MFPHAFTGTYNVRTPAHATPRLFTAPIVDVADDECWSQVKDRMREVFGEAIYNSWFSRMELETFEAETARISVPSKFIKKWIESIYIKSLLQALQEVKPELLRINLSVRSALRAFEQNNGKEVVPNVSGLQRQDSSTFDERPRPRDCPAIGAAPSPHSRQNSRHDHGSPLDPRLTFESFVSGRSNTLAHAACQQVATARRSDPVMFNPLYIHGGTAQGKTHLLQAMVAVINASGEHNAHYLTAERFMYGFASALRDQKKALAFKDQLRGINVLVIDDLQFIQGKHIPAEFSHILSALLDSGRQVVVASDRLPAELESLDERVRSRLAGGLAVEIGLGDELRLEILCARVNAARTHHPSFYVPPPVLAYIASTITHNGRDIEGALNRLLAYSKLSSQPITMELAERELRDMIRPPEIKRMRIYDIQRVVSSHFNIDRIDLLSARRTANVVLPRQIAMYLAKTLTLRSLPEIGRRFGGKDHSTVLHSVRKIEALVSSDSEIAAIVDALTEEIGRS